jgi:hypothetical protein
MARINVKQQREWQRQYYKVHRKERLAYAKKYRKSHKQKIREYSVQYRKVYINTHRCKKCVDCGEQLKDPRSILCRPCAMKRVYSIPERCPAYIDGRSYEPYAAEFNRAKRDRIRKRDAYTCQICWMTEEEHIIVHGTKLHIHHIDYNKKNNEDDNLVSTCNHCNVRANYNRGYWMDYFKQRVVAHV